MKAIIFGISGQDGFYLNEVLAANSCETIGVSRSSGNWVQGDVGDLETVSGLVKKHRPDYIFHLAANSSTRHDLLFENHRTISNGTLNVLESVKLHSPKTKVFITGSGVQFKNEGLPINEHTEFDASSPYSIARIQSVYAARYYRLIGIRTYIGYLFHHESPLRKEHHISKLTTDFIKNLKPGSNSKLELGDISVKKEWAFAKDIAEGIFALVKQDVLPEACIGTGRSYSIEDWLKVCFSLKKLNYLDHIVATPGPFKAEYKQLISDPTIISKIGWKARTSFEALAEIMMQ
jgi:GDPmannose 4,6-dehydratase